MDTRSAAPTKVNQLLAHNLKPIVCVGEVLEERESGRQQEVVKRQVEGGLFHLDANQIQQVVIAYEPVWAIGTGKTATPDQAQEMHAFIRSLLKEKYGAAVADEISILYGGSCKPSNRRCLAQSRRLHGHCHQLLNASMTDNASRVSVRPYAGTCCMTRLTPCRSNSL